MGIGSSLPTAMADDQLTPNRQITGDDILSEILRNCEAGAFKIRHTVVLPCIYHVYLHPSDFDLIRRLIPALTAEARSALIDKLEDLSESSKPSAIAKALGFEGKQAEYKILDPDWTIEFHADTEEKLGKGDIEVYSELASAEKPEFDGAMTRHVTRSRPSPQPEAPSIVPPVAPVPPAPPPASPRSPVEDDVSTGAVTVRTGSHAELRWEDGSGPRRFAVAKDQIVIGRGGKSFWVDVKLDAPPDVSREHCRIRRDAQSGKFYLKDLSQFGTAIDGRRVASSLDREQRDQNVEVPLPQRCTLRLADVFDLEFEATS